jgi:hypothetical protein
MASCDLRDGGDTFEDIERFDVNLATSKVNRQAFALL